jgi:hypothetical protein
MNQIDRWIQTFHRVIIALRQELESDEPEE